MYDPAGDPSPPLGYPPSVQYQSSPGAVDYPPAPGGRPHTGYEQYQPPAYVPKKRAWVPWIVAVVVILPTLGCCLLAFALFAGEPYPLERVTGGAIALIHLDGVIAGTRDSGDVTPEAMIEALDRADNDGRIKAILLRIDSPGGTVAASEEIASAVKNASKPVVASIGDVGASGAYMVASQCDEIVAVEGSSVGSIGVILQVPNIEELAKKLGVSVVIIKAGEYKDTGSLYRSLTASETALLQKEVDDVYQQFIDIVAEGRDMPKAKVRELATGFAWSGAEAQKRGLVDALGTYSDAVDRAAELGGIEGEPDVITFDTAPTLDLLDLLFGLTGGYAGRLPLEGLDRGTQLQPLPEYTARGVVRMHEVIPSASGVEWPSSHLGPVVERGSRP